MRYRPDRRRHCHVLHVLGQAYILFLIQLGGLGMVTFTSLILLTLARIMQKIGVTETIFPERESSINLATRISRSNALLNYVRLGSGFSMQGMAVPNK